MRATMVATFLTLAALALAAGGCSKCGGFLSQAAGEVTQACRTDAPAR